MAVPLPNYHHQTQYSPVLGLRLSRRSPIILMLFRCSTVLSPQTKIASPRGSGSPRNSPIKIIESCSKCSKVCIHLKYFQMKNISQRGKQMLSLKSPVQLPCHHSLDSSQDSSYHVWHCGSIVFERNIIMSLAVCWCDHTKRAQQCSSA